MQALRGSRLVCPALLPAVFWTAVTLYVGSLVYLILTPEGAGQLAASISRNVSRWSLHQGGDGSSGAGSGSGARAAAVAAAGVEPAGPLLASPWAHPLGCTHEGGGSAKAASGGRSGTSDAARGGSKGDGGLSAHPISVSPDQT